MTRRDTPKMVRWRPSLEEQLSSRLSSELSYQQLYELSWRGLRNSQGHSPHKSESKGSLATNCSKSWRVSKGGIFLLGRQRTGDLEDNAAADLHGVVGEALIKPAEQCRIDGGGHPMRPCAI